MIQLRAACLAAVIGLVAAPAMATTATTLEFDTAPIGAFTSFTDDGFLVAVTSGSAVIAANGSQGNDIETAAGAQATITITSATPGGTFDPTSFLFAIVGPSPISGGSVLSSGLLSGSQVSGGGSGGSAQTSYSYSTETVSPNDPNNPDVDTLNITLNGEGNAYTAISDVNLTAVSTPAAVPEPPALSVLGTGILALAGVMLLRHKKV